MLRVLAKSGLVALGLLSSLATWAHAQQTTFTLDPARTTVSFTLGASLHTVHGTFQVKEGTIGFDTSTGVASGRVVLDVSSGQTGNKKRDRTMHRDVLQSERYPEIIFTPTRITGDVLLRGESRVQLDGIVRLQGSDHTITVAVQVQPNGNQLRATTQFIVPYVAWGLKNPSNFLLHVADTVELSVVAFGELTPAPAKP